MSGPPSNVEPDALWALITSIPRPMKLVDFPRNVPGTDEPVAKLYLQILTQQEQMAAAMAAEKYAREALKEYGRKGDEGLGYDNLYNNAAATEVLYRAAISEKSVEERTHRPFFPSPREMRNVLTPDEIGTLMAAYLQFQSECGPIVAHMSEGEMEAWVKRLVEGGSAFPLYRCSSEAVSELVMLMASRLYNSLTDTSSPGSQPDDATQKS